MPNRNTEVKNRSLRRSCNRNSSREVLSQSRYRTYGDLRHRASWPLLPGSTGSTNGNTEVKDGIFGCTRNRYCSRRAFRESSDRPNRELRSSTGLTGFTLLTLDGRNRFPFLAITKLQDIRISGVIDPYTDRRIGNRYTGLASSACRPSLAGSARCTGSTNRNTEINDRSFRSTSERHRCRHPFGHCLHITNGKIRSSTRLSGSTCLACLTLKVLEVEVQYLFSVCPRDFHRSSGDSDTARNINRSTRYPCIDSSRRFGVDLFGNRRDDLTKRLIVLDIRAYDPDGLWISNETTYTSLPIQNLAMKIYIPQPALQIEVTISTDLVIDQIEYTGLTTVVVRKVGPFLTPGPVIRFEGKLSGIYI